MQDGDGRDFDPDEILAMLHLLILDIGDLLLNTFFDNLWKHGNTTETIGGIQLIIEAFSFNPAVRGLGQKCLSVKRNSMRSSRLLKTLEKL